MSALVLEESQPDPLYDPKLWRVLQTYLDGSKVSFKDALVTFRARRRLFRLDIFGALFELNKNASFGLAINQAQVSICLTFPNGYMGHPRDNDFEDNMKKLLSIIRNHDV